MCTVQNEKELIPLPHKEKSINVTRLQNKCSQSHCTYFQRRDAFSCLNQRPFLVLRSKENTY